MGLNNKYRDKKIVDKVQQPNFYSEESEKDECIW